MDKLTQEQRSWNMSRIRSGNTAPELFVRSLLFKSGFRYRLHEKKLPGKPDIVMKKYKTVIFIHGCFWHFHENCKYAKIPATRYDWWKQKLLSNVERDKQNTGSLIKSGWRVFIIWECAIKQMIRKNPNRFIDTFTNFLTSNESYCVFQDENAFMYSSANSENSAMVAEEATKPYS